MSDNSLLFGKCHDCGQLSQSKCVTCHQFILPDNKFDILKCKTCEQIRPTIDLTTEKEDTSSSEEEEEYEVQKDGTHRVVCRCCKRPAGQCPVCEQDYDSEQDETTPNKINKKRKREPQPDEDEEADIEADDEDDDDEHPRQSLRKKQKLKPTSMPDEDESSDEES